MARRSVFRLFKFHDFCLFSKMNLKKTASSFGIQRVSPSVYDTIYIRTRPCMNQVIFVVTTWFVTRAPPPARRNTCHDLLTKKKLTVKEHLEDCAHHTFNMYGLLPDYVKAPQHRGNCDWGHWPYTGNMCCITIFEALSGLIT